MVPRALRAGRGLLCRAAKFRYSGPCIAGAAENCIHRSVGVPPAASFFFRGRHRANKHVDLEVSLGACLGSAGGRGPARPLSAGGLARRRGRKAGIISWRGRGRDAFRCTASARPLEQPGGIAVHAGTKAPVGDVEKHWLRAGPHAPSSLLTAERQAFRGRTAIVPAKRNKRH